MTARALGFREPTRNSIDTVSDRDFAIEFLAIAAICAVHLSRLAEEIVIWSTPQFGFVRLSDAFSTGSSIMKIAKGDEQLKDTAQYLWDIALGIEEGDLSLAERRLRDAQQNLADALNRNAPDAEIKKLMDELRKAMQDYMNELAQRLQNMTMGHTTRNPIRPDPELESPENVSPRRGPIRRVLRWLG